MHFFSYFTLRYCRLSCLICWRKLSAAAAVHCRMWVYVCACISNLKQIRFFCLRLQKRILQALRLSTKQGPKSWATCNNISTFYFSSPASSLSIPFCDSVLIRNSSNSRIPHEWKRSVFYPVAKAKSLGVQYENQSRKKVRSKSFEAH